MDSVEVSAKTVEEAVQRALEKLGAKMEEVEVVVLKKGKSGLLGLGAEEAKVMVSRLPAEEVTPPPAELEGTKVTEEVLEKLLDFMDVSADVQASQIPATDSGTGPRLSLNLKGEDLGILIGRRGQTLASLQYILTLLVSHRLNSHLPLTLDVEGYKERRYKSLQPLALRMAGQVKATGRMITLEPMPANERRIVHLALAERDDVVTQSVGEGEARKVAIMAKDSRRTASGKRGSR